jgi:Ca-activated chloride channel family protein
MQAALDAAIEMRTKDEGRSFTCVFFTDGQPTLGEMKPENILKNVAAKNTANTRFFTFGVGDDVNTTFLDNLAESTRAVSTYVRPAEDIEEKATSLYGKISHPVMSNVKLTSSDNIRLFETYPAQLPDLFWGSQLVVLGKYTGNGPGAVKLTGQVGTETKEFAYDVNFPSRTTDDKDFVEHLWARRKVGFLLDQIRQNGEQKELMDEMMTLAKHYGIATPYTSFLVVPDAPMPVVGPHPGPHPIRPRGGPPVPPALFSPQFGGAEPGGVAGGGGGPGAGGGGFGGAMGKPTSVIDFAKKAQAKPEDVKQNRFQYEDKMLCEEEKRLEAKGAQKASSKDERDRLSKVKEARGNFRSYEQARQWLNQRDLKNVQAGNSTAVDVAVCSNNLRQQERLTQTAMRNVCGRNCLEIGGVWIDEGFGADMKTVIVKAQSEAYFKIIEKQAKMKDVFRLGNHLVYVTPSMVALVVDSNDGKESLTDEEIEKLFVPAKVK